MSSACAFCPTPRTPAFLSARMRISLTVAILLMSLDDGAKLFHAPAAIDFDTHVRGFELEERLFAEAGIGLIRLLMGSKQSVDRLTRRRLSACNFLTGDPCFFTRGMHEN